MNPKTFESGFICSSRYKTTIGFDPIATWSDVIGVIHRSWLYVIYVSSAFHQLRFFLPFGTLPDLLGSKRQMTKKDQRCIQQSKNFNGKPGPPNPQKKQLQKKTKQHHLALSPNKTLLLKNPSEEDSQTKQLGIFCPRDRRGQKRLPKLFGPRRCRRSGSFFGLGGVDMGLLGHHGR